MQTTVYGKRFLSPTIAGWRPGRGASGPTPVRAGRDPPGARVEQQALAGLVCGEHLAQPDEQALRGGSV